MLKEVRRIEVLAQTDYQITNTTNDHFTLSYNKTSVSVDGLAGDTFITLSSVSGILAGDYIGIVLDTNYLFWTTVDSISGSNINFPSGITLTSDASSGNLVFTYTTALDVPMTVYDAVRNDQRMNPSTDVPMNYLSYDE